MKKKTSAHTEFADKDSFNRVRSPLSVRYRAIRIGIQPKLLVSLREAVITAFGDVDGILPLSEQIVTSYDIGNIWLEVAIDLEDGICV